MGDAGQREATEPEATQPPPVLALVKDLIFSSRIGATARGLGVPVRVVRDPARLARETEARLLIVDLNLDGAIEAAARWSATAGGPPHARRVVGFVSHVDAATITRAREAGLREVMARSRFVETLPDLLKGG